MQADFRSSGWINLNNRHAILTINRIDVDAVGVNNPHIGLGKFPAAHTRPSGSKPRITIGLTHVPYVRTLDTMVDDGYSLVFMGYTHGDQVYVPEKGALITDCDLPTTLVAGLYGWPDADQVICRDGAAVTTYPGVQVNVSADLDASPFVPVHLVCGPEVIIFNAVLP